MAMVTLQYRATAFTKIPTTWTLALFDLVTIAAHRDTTFIASINVDAA